MSRWRNFSIWRGKLPHWRADGVRYFVTFRHRRPLTEEEQQKLFRAFLKLDGKRLEVLVACVREESTHLIVQVVEKADGSFEELSKVIEAVKTKLGKDVCKKTGERWPPLWSESYDHIVRDDQDLETLLLEHDIPPPEDAEDLNVYYRPGV